MTRLEDTCPHAYMIFWEITKKTTLAALQPQAGQTAPSTALRPLHI